MSGTGNRVWAERSGGLENLSVWTGSSTKQKDTVAQNQGFLPEKAEEKRAGKNDEKLFLEGYSKNAIAEAFECLPETVTARIKRAEEDMNGT